MKVSGHNILVIDEWRNKGYTSVVIDQDTILMVSPPTADESESSIRWQAGEARSLTQAEAVSAAFDVAQSLAKSFNQQSEVGHRRPGIPSPGMWGIACVGRAGEENCRVSIRRLT
jgi:hypothetical protein